MRLPALVAVAIACTASLSAARADTFQYNLSFSDSSVTSTATFTVPVILTSPTTITATGTSTLGTVGSVDAYPGDGSCPIISGTACFQTNLGNGQFDKLVFRTNVESVGKFTDTYGHGTLQILDIPGTTTVTPEPSSIALLGTGLLGIAGLARKRFA